MEKSKIRGTQLGRLFAGSAEPADGRVPPLHDSQLHGSQLRSADLLLQVRCAVCNGTLGSDFGRKLRSTNDPSPPMAVAA